MLMAEGILKQHWDRSIPVNLARIARAMGVMVAFAQLPAQVCARIEFTQQRKRRILLDRNHLKERQRYGVAHALGHVALNHLRPGLAHNIVASENYRVNVAQRQDGEANDFALRLLLPEPALRHYLQNLAEKDIYAPEGLAAAFEVAPILLKQRMADLDLSWPQTLAQQLRPQTLWEQD